MNALLLDSAVHFAIHNDSTPFDHLVAGHGNDSAVDEGQCACRRVYRSLEAHTNRVAIRMKLICYGGGVQGQIGRASCRERVSPYV